MLQAVNEKKSLSKNFKVFFKAPLSLKGQDTWAVAWGINVALSLKLPSGGDEEKATQTKLIC